ncbi:hypothetical protein [uncultured Winogradskyella sp.]|uniref:hypothetical protein n=1 Tax=uncultured Winogradskyella sp. TaxID=395353 RepID=UPI0026376CDD|nr:hypothetical protein [uncultured Winogradskyella sp.]
MSYNISELTSILLRSKNLFENGDMTKEEYKKTLNEIEKEITRIDIEFLLSRDGKEKRKQ